MNWRLFRRRGIDRIERVSAATIDFRPKTTPENLPRGVHPFREYEVFDHEKRAWIRYHEFLYETSFGSAHITVASGKSLQAGMATAQRLLREDRATFIQEPGVYGTSNSLNNYEDLYSGAPLSLVLARSGAYTERSVGRILEVFTGDGKIPPSRLHRLMADRPALTLPYQPFFTKSYKRIKPGFTPPEVKMKYATPFGTSENELLLAGKILNRWSDAFYTQVLEDVDYTLWITGGEKKAMCLSLVPLVFGMKMDVVGIPGAWMWGKKQPDESWVLAPELMSYRFAAKDGRRRLVGILFDQDNWRNLQVADALLRLCKALREVGAMVFVAVIPPGAGQNGIDDFFAKHCLKDYGFDFGPLLDLMNRSIQVDRDYTVSYPSPDVTCRLKTLAERAERFCEHQEKARSFFELSDGFVDGVVSDLGRFLDPDSSDLNGGRFLSSFRALRQQRQVERWVNWMENNPFQQELDRQLDRYIPGMFRGRAALDPKVTLEEVMNDRLPPRN